MQYMSDNLRALPEVNLRPVIIGGGRLMDPVDPEVGRLIPETTARRCGLLPFASTPQGIHVAISRLPDAEGEQNSG